MKHFTMSIDVPSFHFDDDQKCIANKEGTEECIQLLSRFTNSLIVSEENWPNNEKIYKILLRTISDNSQM